MALRSLAHLTLIDIPPPELVDIAASAGFDAVGLRISPAGPGDEPYPMGPGSPLLRATRSRLASTGVRVLDVEVARLDADTDPASFAPALESAAELGARYLLVNVYGEDRARAAAQFAEVCDLATSVGVRPVLEFMPYSAVRCLGDAVRVAGKTWGGILVDALHLYRSGGSPADLASLDPGRVPYVQLCDGPRSAPADGVGGLVDESRHRRLPPAQGEFDLCGILAALEPPDLDISVEAPSDALRARHGARGLARLLCRSLEDLLPLHKPLV
jgi:sugar phosphate isomerase/epimerase